MKTILKSDFECIYSINGRIIEGGIVNLEENKVYYITVFPLNATYLSYTIKMVGDKIYTNKDLCVKVTTKEETYILFCKRYPYVYATTPFSYEGGCVCEFFTLIKQNRIDKARSLLSDNLSKSVSDDALKGFFEKYEYVLDTDDDNKWILATQNGEGEYFTFILKHGLIDDISN